MDFCLAQSTETLHVARTGVRPSRRSPWKAGKWKGWMDEEPYTAG